MPHPAAAGALQVLPRCRGAGAVSHVERRLALAVRRRQERDQDLAGLPSRELEAHVAPVGHDLEMIRETCTRVLLLDGGQLVADGATQQILSDTKLMETHGLEVPHSLTHHAATEQHHKD